MAAENVKWEIVVREIVSHECVLSPAASHPLKPTSIVTTPLPQREESKISTPLDPLSALSAKQDTQPADPLSFSSSVQTDESIQSSLEQKEDDEPLADMCDEEGIWCGGEKFISWAVRKTQIVQTFTTTGTIQMPSFVSSEVVTRICLFSCRQLHFVPGRKSWSRRQHT